VRVAGAENPQGGPQSLAQAEKTHIHHVLDAMGWNISRASQVLEIDRGTLYHKIERYGIPRPTPEKG